MHKTATALALALALASPLPGSAAGQPVQVELLTYNVKNLPDSDFADRARAILPILGRYDLAVLQEDFGPDGLSTLWPGPVWRGPESRWRWQYLLAPLARPLGYRAPYDSGLTMLASLPTQATLQTPQMLQASATPRRPIVSVDPLVSVAYDSCHGWVSHAHDCWASKGVLGMRVNLVTGASFDLYTTHLDAGSDPGDHAARLRQFQQLREAITEYSAGHAVVVAGDFNTPRKRPEQHAALLKLKQALGLKDSGVHPTHAAWRPCQRDFILIRASVGLALDVIDGGEPPATTPGATAEGVDFCGGSWRGQALSDHPALAVRLGIRSTD